MSYIIDSALISNSGLFSWAVLKKMFNLACKLSVLHCSQNTCTKTLKCDAYVGDASLNSIYTDISQMCTPIYSSFLVLFLSALVKDIMNVHLLGTKFKSLKIWYWKWTFIVIYNVIYVTYINAIFGNGSEIFKTIQHNLRLFHAH